LGRKSVELFLRSIAKVNPIGTAELGDLLNPVLIGAFSS
jgi:hypothetical protein